MSSVLLRGVLVWYLISLNLLSQSQPGVAKQGGATPTQGRKSAPLTPRQQKGLRMLQAAEAEAKALPAPMKAYLLLELASSYTETNPTKERSLRLQAFQSTLYIEDDDDNKEFVQDQTLRELLSTSWPDLEMALPKAIPILRNRYAAELSQGYARSKRYDRALQWLHQVAAEGQFPYGAAATLMLHLPEDHVTERQEIFSEALASYEASTGPEEQDFTDMATLVIRFWDKLPPALVLEATDQILDRAKRETDAGLARVFNVSSGKGAVSLGTIYGFRLFQLLPVLQKLDESKAEQLLQENPNLKGLLEQYPEGMRSLDTGLTGTPKGKREEHSDFLNISNDPIPHFDAAAVRLGEEIKDQQKTIFELARHDPKQALKSALALPGSGEIWRAQTLSIVGQIIGAHDPAIAKTAVKEATNLSVDFDPVFRLDILKDAASLYLDLKDQEGATRPILDGTKLAEDLYAKDTDPSKPNLALKAQWPSTNVWRQFVGLAARISPEAATKLIDEVPDSEIHAFLRVALASSLLGQEPAAIRSVRRDQDREIIEVW